MACDQATVGVHRYTFRDLVNSLASPSMYALDLAPLGPVAAEAVAAHIIRKVQLRYLHSSAEFPGFARALARTLRDIRLNGIDLDTLQNVGRSGPDLALLLEAWNAELQERGLADYAHSVELAISSDADPGVLIALDLELRTSAERNLINVLARRASATLRLGVNIQQSSAATALSSVRRYVASRDVAPTRTPDRTTTFFSASSEALEFVEIARRILVSGLPFDQTAVLLRNPARHLPLLDEAFRRAGIPVWLEGGLARRDTSGRAFLALLRCRLDGYSAARFCEYLSAGCTPDAHPSWERLINAAAVIAGLERWHSRLKEDQYESLRNTALPIIDALARLREHAHWREWITALKDLAQLALNDTRSVENALAHLAALGDLGPVPLPGVLLVLERLLASWYDAPEGHRYGRVFAAAIDDARGMTFRLFFIPGLNEGLFPKTPREDPLLLDEQRNALHISRRREEIAILNAALATIDESGCFSWSRLDLATGRERVPSFFAAEIISSARGAGVDVATVLSEAKATVKSKIGWSAPEDPTESIDDAEYDLATFRETYTQKRSMAWLREVSPIAVRAIEARQRRWSPSWSDADGINADFDMAAAIALDPYQIAQHAYSPTLLNEFARCPYRFYLSAIARLQPVRVPSRFDRLDVMSRGHIYHRTLFRHFIEMRPLEEALAGVAHEIADKLAPAIRGSWATEIEKIRADLQAWMNGRDPDWQPMLIELAFGLADPEAHDPNSVRDPVRIEGKWPLRGSIDFVERHPDGRLRVLDHKTGKPERKDFALCVGKGEVLQPILYALALEALGYPTPAVAALSFGTLRGGFRTDEIRIDSRAREAVAKVMSGIEYHLHRGFLPAAPRKDACHRCEYLPICGPWEEIRVDQKDTSELKVLRNIRGLR
ncbi:MAG: PD-(D/E)XK nuclease family protein [Bryobacteraceae bacterium]